LVPVPNTNPITPQCIDRYTSEGILIKQFNICSGTQLADFVSNLPGSNAYELRILPSGDTFVADTENVVRLDSSGAVIQTYLDGAGASTANPLFAVNFDPDGESFWTGAINSGDVLKIDMATGNLITNFNTGSFATGITVKSSPLYAAIIGAPTCGGGGVNGVYKSVDSGLTWKLVSNAAMNALFVDGTTVNAKIALGTAGNVYVGIENNRRLAGLFRSPDGGVTWASMDIPVTTEGCATFGINPGSQGDIHFSLAADPNNDKIVIHIDALPAEVDEHYILAVGVLGDIGQSLRGIALKAKPRKEIPFRDVRKSIVADRREHSKDKAFPVKPQKIVWDLRQALGPEDIVISDVGAHKMWTARMYQAERPNTCIISNGFAAMGIAVPGALAAKLAYPERKVVAVTGDAGFLMNSQEIETALRVGTPFVILIWNDAEYGLITWHQLRHFGRASHIAFDNPDFVKYAESFGAKGYRVEKAADLISTLKAALAEDRVTVIDCPVDYAENMKLTQWQKELKSPL
jgi:hypothetical protein